MRGSLSRHFFRLRKLTGANATGSGKASFTPITGSSGAWEGRRRGLLNAFANPPKTFTKFLSAPDYNFRLW